MSVTQKCRECDNTVQLHPCHQGPIDPAPLCADCREQDAKVIHAGVEKRAAHRRGENRPVATPEDIRQLAIRRVAQKQQAEEKRRAEIPYARLGSLANALRSTLNILPDDIGEGSIIASGMEFAFRPYGERSADTFKHQRMGVGGGGHRFGQVDLISLDTRMLMLVKRCHCGAVAYYPVKDLDSFGAALTFPADCAKCPESMDAAPDGRQERAKVVAETYIFEEFAPGQWTVAHPTEPERSYVVDLSSLRGHSSCSCPDCKIMSALTGAPFDCKHLISLTTYKHIIDARSYDNVRKAS